MCTVPARVYFVAFVFALSTVYVSQEVGSVFAQSVGSGPMPPQPMGPPPNNQMGPNQMGGQQAGGPQGGQFGKMDQGQFGGQPQQQQPMQPQQFQNDQKQGGVMEKGQHEDSDAQQSKMEAQRAEQMKKQFAQMKKQFGQMGSMLKKVEARVAAVEKQGVKAPTELAEALANAKIALATVQNAQSLEDDGVQDAMQALQESGHTLQQGMQQLEMLGQMPQMLKQAASEIKKLEASYTRSQKLVSRAKIDVSSQMAEFRKAIDTIKAGYANAQQLIQSGDAEGASEALKTDVWDNMQDAYQYPGMIEALSNVKKYLTNFDKFIARAAKSKAVGGDSEASAALQDMRTKVVELKQSATQATTDPEELKSAINDIFELQSTIQGVLGTSNPMSAQSRQNGNSSFDFSAFGQVNDSQGQR